MNTTRNNLIHLVMLLALIAGAFFLRFYDIENIPSGLYPDEAVNGMDALNSIESGHYKLFYPDNSGREGLFINLQALSVKTFGHNIPALKLWSAIFGTLAVLGTFLLSKEIFRSWRAGLISAYLMTFSFWTINFSRIGFRAIMVPFILSFSLYFLLKGFRTKKYIPFILAGLIFGLGFHTYIAFRIAPAIVVALLFFMFIVEKNFIKTFWKQIFIFGIATFIALSPMIWEFKTHPEYLESRSSSVSIFSPQMNHGDLVGTFLRSFGLSLAKYNFWGDQNWRHNYPPYPILDPVVGITFLAGFLYVLYKAFLLLYLRYRHDIRDEKLYLYFFLLSWFAFMLAPEFLTAEGLPHALRAIGTQPVVMIIATIPFLWLFGKIPHNSYSMKIVFISILAAAFIFVGVFNTVKYFVFFKNNPRHHVSFSTNLKDVAYQMRTYPDSTEKYVIAENMERIPIKFLNHEMPKSFYVYPGEISKIKPSGDFVILLTDDRLIDKVKQTFPDLQTIEHEQFKGDKFWEMRK